MDHGKVEMNTDQYIAIHPGYIVYYMVCHMNIFGGHVKVTEYNYVCMNLFANFYLCIFNSNCGMTLYFFDFKGIHVHV